MPAVETEQAHSVFTDLVNWLFGHQKKNVKILQFHKCLFNHQLQYDAVCPEQPNLLSSRIKRKPKQVDTNKWTESLECFKINQFK